ncbi:MAG: hypothetical protein V1754_09490 [Pseudomonadota bacterium]
MSLPKICEFPRRSSIATLLVAVFWPCFAFAQSVENVSPAEDTAPNDYPTTKIGSLGPGIHFEEISYTLRAAYFRTVTVSPHNPQVAYVGSWDGYVWKTTDGGKTWDESRLILEQQPFYGDAGQFLYFGVHREDAPDWNNLHLSMDEEWERPVAGSLSLAGTRPSAVDGHRSVYPRAKMVLSKAGDEDLSAGGIGRAGAEGNVNFGVGLPGRAPRLQLVVRKFGKTTSGLNIKQTLLLRGTRPREVRIIVVHPKNPNIVFACTMFGLFKTYDGGLNWVRTFQGINPAGRQVYHVAIDPQDDNKVLLASGNGLYVSNDSGENFIKTTSQGVGDGIIDWIYFNPYDSRYVFIGTGSGVLRSQDGGNSWEWIYFTTFPPARIVRSIVIDPFDHKTGYIGTHDGIFVTPNILKGDLESWERLGGPQFTGLMVIKIEVCPKHKGHLWAMSDLYIPSATKAGTSGAGSSLLWESLDAGVSWRVIFSGNTQGEIAWFDKDGEDPDLLWVAWSQSLVRMKKHEEKGQISKEKEKEILRAFEQDRFPRISEVLMAAMRYTGTDPGMLLKYRARSQIKALIPRLDASYAYSNYQNYPLRHDGLYPSFPFFRKEMMNGPLDEFRVMLTWDLSNLVFKLDTTLFGRVDRLNHEIRERTKFAVHCFYSELKRLRFMMMTRPPEEFRVRLMYKLRIKELESYLNFITGNYLERYKKGDKPSGWDTERFEKWTGDTIEGG